VVRCELLPTVTLEHDGEPIGVPSAPAEVDQFVHDLGFVAQFDDIRRRASAAGSGRGEDGHGRIGPPIDAEFGRRVLEVICAAYRSAGRSADGSISIEELPFTGPRDRTPIQLFH
jgi:hypothetical protein